MKKLLFIFTLITLVLTACAAGVANGSQTETGRNREKWQDAKITHYRYSLHLSCFCVFVENMPLIIEVQDGEVVSMAFHNGKEIDPGLLETFDKYATIDRLFAELEADIDGAADSVTATYDETYGFPTEVTIDFLQEATDDELHLSLSNFEPLP